jgi:tetratricopeptide (TPR) repeat protein
MSRIIFLPVPENFLEQFKSEGYGFTIKKNIPIPVEIDGDSEEVNLANLSLEAIIYGMLRVIEERQVKQEWLDYYSGLILFLCPDILTKLREIKGINIDDGSYEAALNFVKNGEPQKGLTLIKGFIENNPLVWNGWFVLGMALRLLGRQADSEAALKKAIELGGDSDEVMREIELAMSNESRIKV